MCVSVFKLERLRVALIRLRWIPSILVAARARLVPHQGCSLFGWCVEARLLSRGRCLRALVCLYVLVLMSMSVSAGSKTKFAGQNSNQLHLFSRGRVHRRRLREADRALGRPGWAPGAT
jgi:hypothetical protein